MRKAGGGQQMWLRALGNRVSLLRLAMMKSSGFQARSLLTVPALAARSGPGGGGILA